MERKLQINVRAKPDTEKMEFTGIGVPYGQEIEVWGTRETFAPGSVDLAPGAPVLWQHDTRTPVGVIVSGRHTAEGYEITGQLSDTTAARDAWTLLKDGAVAKLSIGFESRNMSIDSTVDPPLVTHTNVLAREFSLVTFPAYDQAAITSHRSKDSITMTNTLVTPPALDTETRAELTSMAESITDLTRQVGLLGTATTAPAAPEYRSMGHYLKMLARGDDTAAKLHESLATRAFDANSTVLADSITTPEVVTRWLRLIQQKRRVINMFGTAPLPDTGLKIEYAQVKEDSTKVEKQTAEGNDLAKGKVTLETQSATIETYGGWSELSRQVIERASINHLDVTLTALGLKYAKATESAFRAAVNGAITAQTAALTLPAAATWKDWLSLYVDASEMYDDTIYTLSGLLVSADTFKALMTTETSNGAPLMNVWGSAVNQIGSIDVAGLTGNLSTLQVQVMPGLTGPSATFFDAEAAKWSEASNSPAQLQDENIVNLSKSFSVYGYGGAIVPFPAAFKPVNLGGTAPAEPTA